MSLKGKKAPVIDGVTGPQRFYLGFAQIWRSKYRDAAMERQLTVGPHSPGNWRPMTVRNHAPWYEAFGVKPGDRMYLPEDERVNIWQPGARSAGSSPDGRRRPPAPNPGRRPGTARTAVRAGSGRRPSPSAYPAACCCGSR